MTVNYNSNIQRNYNKKWLPYKQWRQREEQEKADTQLKSVKAEKLKLLIEQKKEIEKYLRPLVTKVDNKYVVQSEKCNILFKASSYIEWYPKIVQSIQQQDPSIEYAAIIEHLEVYINGGPLFKTRN